MIQMLRQTGWMVVRQTRNLMREPIWIALMVIQPLIWLLLYGQLFSRVPTLRGGAGSYVAFLAPGIVCMNAFFGGSWSGMAMISDLDRHVIDRFLATPASRFAIILSQVVRAGITAMLQALLLLLVGFALGVRVQGGALGWLVVFLASALLAMTFAGFSHGIALLVRTRGVDDRGRELHRPAAHVPLRDPDPGDGHAGLDQGGLPLQPGELGRGGGAQRDRHRRRLERDGIYLLLLLAAAAVTSSFATWCFRSYQRSL